MMDRFLSLVSTVLSRDERERETKKTLYFQKEVNCFYMLALIYIWYVFDKCVQIQTFLTDRFLVLEIHKIIT